MYIRRTQKGGFGRSTFSSICLTDEAGLWSLDLVNIRIYYSQSHTTEWSVKVVFVGHLSRQGTEPGNSVATIGHSLPCVLSILIRSTLLGPGVDGANADAETQSLSQSFTCIRIGGKCHC